MPLRLLFKESSTLSTWADIAKWDASLQGGKKLYG